jgi:hypothetical protein
MLGEWAMGPLYGLRFSVILALTAPEIRVISGVLCCSDEAFLSGAAKRS